VARIVRFGKHSRLPKTFYLQSDVFLCRGRWHWVILDATHNKYFCIDRRQFESLGPWLHGWEKTIEDSEHRVAEPPDDAGALANMLVSRGILSERAEGAKPARATAYALPNDGACVNSPLRSLGSTCTHAPSFFISATRASRQLRDQPFQSVTEFVRARKRRNEGPARPFNFERAHSLISVFDSLRLFFPRPYQCLFDSLALINFLARFRLYPDWVFGVMAEPFEAHCWVQAGGVVLNDTIKRVSAFTPIMHV
jgi:hypothetical protein